MIVSLICLSAMQSLNAADYFPCTPGQVRTYEDKHTHSMLVNKVGQPMDMGGVQVFPITESTGPASRPTYYRIDQDMVSIVAYDLKHPLPTAMPILKIGKDEVRWEFSGATATGPAGEMLKEVGSARLGGTRMFNDKKVDVLVVNVKATVGSGASGVLIQQETVYGKGLGPIEITTSARLGGSKKAREEHYKLLSIDTAK